MGLWRIPAGVSRPDGNIPDLSSICLLGACCDLIPLSRLIKQEQKSWIQRYTLKSLTARSFCLKPRDNLTYWSNISLNLAKVSCRSWSSPQVLQCSVWSEWCYFSSSSHEFSLISFNLPKNMPSALLKGEMLSTQMPQRRCVFQGKEKCMLLLSGILFCSDWRRLLNIILEIHSWRSAPCKRVVPGRSVVLRCVDAAQRVV